MTQDPPDSPPPQVRGGEHGPDFNPARDPEIAVREEFEAAERANTAEAYLRFARRHPDHPLATRARERATALRARE